MVVPAWGHAAGDWYIEKWNAPWSKTIRFVRTWPDASYYHDNRLRNALATWNDLPQSLEMVLPEPYDGDWPEADVTFVACVPVSLPIIGRPCFPIPGNSYAYADATVQGGNRILPVGAASLQGTTADFAGAIANSPFGVVRPGAQVENGQIAWDVAMPENEERFFFAQLNAKAFAQADFAYGARSQFDFHDQLRSPPLYLRTSTITFTITDSVHCFP